MFFKLSKEQKEILSNIVSGKDVDLSPVHQLVVHQQAVQQQPADFESALKNLAAGVPVPVHNNVLKTALTNQDYLNIAAAHGNLEVLKKLVNQQNQDAAIRLLLKHGHIEQFKDLWANNGIKTNVELFDIVLNSGNQDAINFVLGGDNIERGKLNATDSNLEALRGKTLLDIACSHGNIEAVDRLLGLGGKVTQLEKPSHLLNMAGIKLRSTKVFYDAKVLKKLLGQQDFPLLEREGETQEQLKSRVNNLKKSLIKKDNISGTTRIDADVLEVLIRDTSINLDTETFYALIGQKNYKAAKVFIQNRRASLDPSFVGAMVDTAFHMEAQSSSTFLSGVPENYRSALQRHSFLYLNPITLFVAIPLVIAYESEYPMLILPAYILLHGAYNKYYLVPGLLDAIVKLGEGQELNEAPANQQNADAQAAKPQAQEEEIAIEAQNAFIAACISGDSGAVNKMLGETQNIATRAKTLDGKTGIHIAIEAGNIKLLKCFTPEQIMSVVDDKRDSAFGLLLKSKDKIDEEQYNGLVGYFFDTVFVANPRDIKGYTPLHMAAINKNPEIMKKALQMDGVDVLAKNSDGTALFYFGGDTMLLKLIAPKYKELQGSNAEDVNKDLKSYLKRLITSKDTKFTEVLKVLKDAEIDIKVIGDELLDCAIKEEYSNAVKAIIDSIDTIDPKHLFAAAKSSCGGSESKRIVRDLVKAAKEGKCDLNAVSERGYWFNKKNWLDTFLQNNMWKQDMLEQSGYYSELWTERAIGAAFAAVTFFVIQYTERSAFFQLCATGVAYKLSADYYDKHYLKPAVENAMADIEIIER